MSQTNYGNLHSIFLGLIHRSEKKLHIEVTLEGTSIKVNEIVLVFVSTKCWVKLQVKRLTEII